MKLFSGVAAVGGCLAAVSSSPVPYTVCFRHYNDVPADLTFNNYPYSQNVSVH